MDPSSNVNTPFIVFQGRIQDEYKRGSTSLPNTGQPSLEQFPYHPLSTVHLCMHTAMSLDWGRGRGREGEGGAGQ